MRVQAAPFEKRVAVANAELEIVDRFSRQLFRLKIGVKLKPVREVRERLIDFEPVMQLSIAAERIEKIRLISEHGGRDPFSSSLAHQQQQLLHHPSAARISDSCTTGSSETAQSNGTRSRATS